MEEEKEKEIGEQIKMAQWNLKNGTSEQKILARRFLACVENMKSRQNSNFLFDPVRNTMANNFLNRDK